MRLTRKMVRVWWSRRWRDYFQPAVDIWHRDRIARIVHAVIASWLFGALAIFLAERRHGSEYGTWDGALWNVGVLLFSGLESQPKTVIGKLLAMGLLGTGVGLAGLFTASIASIFIERYFNKGSVSHMQMENHLVLCNWSSRGLEWIREVHAKIVQEKRSVVIIHDRPADIDLPDQKEEAAFSDVYIVKGDPTNEVILRRAKVSTAHSIVILADDREGAHADGKSILTCIAIRNLCKSDKRPSIAVECQNLAYRKHLKKAGADEIISSGELGLRLLARTALFHGMTRVYQELLTVGRDANEMYVLPVPESLIGKDFVEVAGMFMRFRGDRRSALLLGVQRDDEMVLNPLGDDLGPLQASDQLILLSRVFLDPSQPLPIVTAADPGTAKTGKTS